MKKFIILLALLTASCSTNEVMSTVLETPSTVPTGLPTDTARPATLTPAPTEQVHRHAICNAETVNLRAGGGTGYIVLVDLHAGDAVEMLDAPIVDDAMELWQKVNAGGRVGYIDPQYICDVTK